MQNNFIAGIHNYCDRWCERCTFTSRCRSFEHTAQLSPEQLDHHNQAFWELISAQFKETFALLQQEALERGISLEITVEEKEVQLETETAIEEAIELHPLPVLCGQYLELAHPFIEEELRTYQADGNKELLKNLDLGIGNSDERINEMGNLADCMDIICWYMFILEAKFRRALHSKAEGEEWEVENNFPKDSDGSAKIALIGVEKSMAAWVRIHTILPEYEDTCLTALSLLSAIQKEGLRAFPAAMEFIRPGFDDMLERTEAY